MKNLFKSIKSSVNKALGRDETEVNDPTSSAENTGKFSADRGPVTPGLESKEEDIGKKVFEKTGREGIGQSSTSTLQPQENPIKTNQGDKYRKPYNKKYNRYNKKKSGNMTQKDDDINS